MQSSILKIEKLKKTYQDGTTVLKGIDLAFSDTELTAIIGSNGSGKSTLLRCSMRLIEPDSGTTHLFGQNISQARGSTLKKLRSQVGFVFQKHNLVPRLSVLSNVLHGVCNRRISGPWCWYQGFARAEDRKEALECLERVGLAEYAARRADRLSGGQSQRVAIARALMQRPKLLIADEPVASLDPASGEEVMQIFEDLARNQGIPVVYVSHHLEHALKFSDRIVGLRAGELELDTTPDKESIQSLQELYG